MARPEIPIDPRTGPEAAFAVELRQLREHAGLTYRGLAQLGHCSYGALCEAARGHHLPTWEVTKAFVKGCAGDEQQWHARWQAADAEVKRNSGTATAPVDDGGEKAAPSESSTVRKPLPNGDVPPLSSITSPQDFHLALKALRTRAGNPSLRSLSVSARKHGDRVLPRSTLADALAHTDRLPSLEIVEAFLSACDVQGTEVDAVKSAWARVAYALQRDSMPRTTRWQDGCPYLGLAAFGEDQAEVFYGRERMTTELLAQLADRVRASVGMLVVTGPSGAGKSSLLRAGLLPSLAKGALGPGSQDWPHLVITPGSAPLDELALHLAQLAGVNNAEVRESLAEHPDTAHLNVRQALLACAAQHAGAEPRVSPDRLVLIVDQFEELFTVVSDQAEREAFITSLCAMAGVGRSTTELPPAIVVLGLRADSLSDCTIYAPLAEATRSNVFLVGPMTEVELRSAVTGPAAAAGLSIESGLVDNVLAELRSTKTADRFDPGALPLLSQAMLLTWEHREGTTLTHHAYAAGGGLHNGIQKSAEEAYNNLTPAQQEAARRIFLRLVTFTDHGQPTRHPIQLTILSTDDDTKAALDEFTTKRLITLRKDTAEVVHEVLVHTWQRLGSWIHQDQELLRMFSQLEGAASTWEANKQDPAFLYQGSRLAAVQENLNETSSAVPPSVQLFLDSSRSHERRGTRKLRSLRNSVVLLTVLAIVATFSGAFIFHQNSTLTQANAAERAASSQLQRAEDPYASILLATEAYSLADTLNTRSALLNAQSQYYIGQLQDESAGHTTAINKVVFSPDGRLLATASSDGTTRIWDVINRRIITTPGPLGLNNDIEFSPDRRFLATTDDKGAALLWDIASNQRIVIPPDNPGTRFSTVTFSPGGSLLATSSENGTAQLWNIVDRQLITRLESPGHIKKITFSPDGTTLAATSADGVVWLWNVINTSHLTSALPNLPDVNPVAIKPTLPRSPQETSSPNRSNYINTAVFCPTGKTLVTISEYGTVQLWNVDNPLHPTPVTTLPSQGKIIRGVACSPDGKTLATASPEGTAQLWDVSESERQRQHLSQQVGTLKSHTGNIYSVAFHPDGHTIATAGDDSIVRLWDTGGPILSTPTIGSGVHEVTFSFLGQILATVGTDGTARLWDRASRSAILIPDSKTRNVTFSRDSHLLATTSTDGNAQLWDIARKSVTSTLPDPTGSIEKVVFSPAGDTLVTTGKIDDKIVQLWNVADSLKPTRLFSLPLTGHPYETVFSGDGRLLATIDADHHFRLWDIANQRAIELTAKLTGLTDDIKKSISKVVFTSDGGSLAAVSQKGTVWRWQLAAASKPPAITYASRNDVNANVVVLSPDGRTMATSNSDDTTIKLWDMDHDGELIATLAGHTDPINTATFSPDSGHLATASADGTVRLWDLDRDRVHTSLCHIIGRASKTQWEKALPGSPYQPSCP
ncbi:MAG: AAA family ATPase [Pseudonocardiaceae bacterium]